MSTITRSLGLLIGKCMPCPKPNASKFAVTTMELDKNLNMYFNKVTTIFAHDPQKTCKAGDIVLLEELPEKLTVLISYKVKEIVFPLGDIKDPLTGKKVSAQQFRDFEEEVSELYGKNERGFKYEKAPPRGWQEGKRDFTDKETYIKYHETGKEEPYAF